jgi:hypothetical protein
MDIIGIRNTTWIRADMDNGFQKIAKEMGEID